MKATASLIVVSFAVAVLPGCAQTVFPIPQNRITSEVEAASRVTISNSVHPAIASATSSQPVDPALPISHMILLLKPSPSQASALDTLIAQQADPNSANFHKFLTPAEFGSAFGVSQGDLNKVTGWLASQGFRVEEVAANRLSITFSGTAGQVASAFSTELRQYVVNSQIHHANATPVQFPAALGPVIQGLVKLHDFHSSPASTGLRPLSAAQASPQYTTANSVHSLVPSDYSVIYDLDPVFSSGFTGASQTIAVVGRSNVNQSDLARFRASYALPSATVTPVFATGVDPGITADADTIEATLDLEWAGAVAPKANILLVLAASTPATDGIDIAAQYAVNNNLAPVLAVTFGSCEAVSNNSFYNALWQQAAAQGMSVVVAAGDNGAAGCDSPSSPTGTVRAVNGMCSTPYNTCVGGTLFNDTANPGEFWFPGNNAVMGSAISYIPETVWNESGTMTGGSNLWATGGGASGIYPKPVWQNGQGVPPDGLRDVPDVSLTAAQHDGYVIEYNGITSVVAGTSAATPAFAGIVALLNQKYGPQGNLNPILYPLATQGMSIGSANAFHDITSGNNSVPGVAGYAAGPGYDQATGLGSVDARQLVNGWATLAGAFSLSASAISVSASPGQNATLTLQVVDTGTFHAPVSLSVSTLPAGVSATFSPTTISSSGSSVLTISVAGNAPPGTFSLTITGVGGGFTRTAAFKLVVLVTPNCTLSATPAALSVVQSMATSTRLVCGNVQGLFPSVLALSISGLPAGVTASFSSASLTAGTGISTLIVNAASTAAPGTYSLAVTASSASTTPAFSSTINVPLTVSAPSTFNITPSTRTINLSQGAAASLTLTSVHSGAFNSSVAFSTSGLPSTITATVSPASLVAPGDGSVTISLQSMSVVPVGTYTMTVLAQGGGLVLRIPISVVVAAAPAFSLSDAGSVLTLRQSNTASITVTTGTLTNGFNGPIALSVIGLPAGVTGVFSPASMAAPGSGSSVLTLTASATAPAGTTMFTVMAVGGTITRTVNVQLIVLAPPTFSISASVPGYNVIAGGTPLLETITAKGTYGYNTAVQLSTGVLPPGFTVSFQSLSINGYNGATTMTIQTAQAVTPGPYSISVIATDPVTGMTQTALINLTVGSFTASLSTPTLTLAPAGSASATVSAVASHYNANIGFSVTGLPFGVTCAVGTPYVLGSGASNLTFSAAATVSPGTYLATVRTAAGGVILSNTVTLTIP